MSAVNCLVLMNSENGVILKLKIDGIHANVSICHMT